MSGIRSWVPEDENVTRTATDISNFDFVTSLCIHHIIGNRLSLNITDISISPLTSSPFLCLSVGLVFITKIFIFTFYYLVFYTVPGHFLPHSS